MEGVESTSHVGCRRQLLHENAVPKRRREHKGGGKGISRGLSQTGTKKKGGLRIREEAEGGPKIRVTRCYSDHHLFDHVVRYKKKARLQRKAFFALPMLEHFETTRTL